MKPDCPVARREDYSVFECHHAVASMLVSKWHYSKGTSNTSVVSHALCRAGEIVGVAMWMPPTKVAAQSVSDDWRNVLCLHRLAVAPGEPQNATGILLSRSMKMVPDRWHTLLTYADSRMGHRGTIYKATNWTDLGDTKGDPVWVDSGGRQVSRKCANKTRSKAEMLSLGYTQLPKSKKRKFVFRRKRMLHTCSTGATQLTLSLP